MLVPAPNWPRQLHRPNFPGVSRLAFVSGARHPRGAGCCRGFSLFRHLHISGMCVTQLASLSR